MTDDEFRRQVIIEETERQYPWLRGMSDADLARHIRRMELFGWAYIGLCAGVVIGASVVLWGIA